MAPAFSSTSGLSSALTVRVSAVRVATACRSFPAPYSPPPRAALRARLPAAPPSATPLRCSRYDGEFVVAARKLVDGPAPAAGTGVDGPAPAAAALKGMIAGLFRPLLDNFHQLCSLKTVFDTEDYHIGMPFGALLACIACYKLWKMDPSTFLDAALGYAFYRLSVLSSQVRRQGFSNDFISRIKFIIVLIMAFKDIDKKIVTLDCIRAPVWFLYLTTFVFDVNGLKKHARSIFYQKYMSSFKPRKADSVYDWSCYVNDA